MKSMITLFKGARLIIEHCMKVKPGDKVLIIADHDHMMNAEALAGAAFAVGAYPLIANVTHHVSSALVSMDVPMEPPVHLAEAMKNSDEIIITTHLEWAFRFAHLNAVRASVDKGVKIASIEEGMEDWDLTSQDIEEMTRKAEKIIQAMNGAKWARVTAPGGTDVRVCIEGRPPLKVVPIKEPGDMIGPIPLWGEVAYASIEDKTGGKIVIDGIMIGVGVYGSLNTPIEWKIEKGRAVEIKGGEEAERLRNIIYSSDKNGNVVAEFAIGTSHKEKFGSPSEKGKLGTVHFALGDNIKCYPGGQSESRFHLDGSVRNVTIEVDGKMIIKNGDLVI